jgi:hypothetical protein
MRRTDLELTEYHDEGRYRSDHPGRLLMRDHNAIVRAAMREASRRGIFCVRRIVRRALCGRYLRGAGKQRIAELSIRSLQPTLQVS